MKVGYIEICGFRSFGPGPQRLEANGPLTVIFGDNSQGKTSLAEALEFLYTGGTSRRQLGGGSPTEYDGTLRNAHLANSSEVYVEAELVSPGGQTQVLRRELLEDYRGAAECRTSLLLDGESIESIAEAGVELADPPLAAPVLLEHAIRYSVSAKPGERSDYFKAALEVADLDLLRAEVAALVTERESEAEEPVVQRLEELGNHGRFGRILARRTPWTLNALKEALFAAIQELVETPDNESSAESDMSLVIETAEASLRARQTTFLPIEELRSPDKPLPTNNAGTAEGANVSESQEASRSVPLSDRVSEYNELLARVDSSLARTLPLFEALMGIDGLPKHERDESIDCPLCETVGSLTADRVSQIREQIAEQEGLTNATSALRLHLSHTSQYLAAVRVWIRESVPGAAIWSPEKIEQYGTAVADLQGATESFDHLIELALAVKSNATEVEGVLGDASATVERLRESSGLGAPVSGADLASLDSDMDSLGRALATQAHLLARSRASAAELIDSVSAELASRSSTEGWAELLDLARNVSGLWGAIGRQQSRDAATRRLKAAQRRITDAVAQVVDEKLEVMATEIRKWWSLMRPDELTTFDSLTRRGAGNRFLDLTASLVPEASSSGVVRSALAVLSNSQLNALGLATFLARCQILRNVAIFLDDPVPGSDREHRYTFADKVIAELLEGGRQVILMTHDPELARTLQNARVSDGLCKGCRLLTKGRH